MKSTNQSTVSRWIWTNENASLRCSFLTHRDAGYVCGQGLEVVEGGGGVPHHEVDGDEEAAEDEAESAGDDGEDDVFLGEDWVPGWPPASVKPWKFSIKTKLFVIRPDENHCIED